MTRTATLPDPATNTVLLFARRSVDRNTFSCLWSLDAGGSEFYNLCTTDDGTTIGLWDDIDDTGPRITLVNSVVNQWYALAAVRDSNLITGYWCTTDAAQLINAGSAAGNTLSPTTLRFFVSGLANEFWNGVLCGIKLWSGVALTAAELEIERRQIMPARTDGLFGFWPMLDASAPVGADISGRGNDMTPNVGATFTAENNPPVPWRLGRRR
jgi:hypothetical protein